MIEVSHLTKQYGNHLAVEDVSFRVEDGRIYGLLGPNGAGKSTIMNILTGYLSATSGQVTVAGHPLPEDADAAKACVGYLPEQPPLYPEMTVQEYLLFAAELKGVRKPERKEQVLRAARRTGLEEVLPRLIRSLSKGYKQRVGIAQALLGNPQIIILDEPTVGLDPAQVIEIRKLIQELGRAHTVILSSHILSEIQTVCQQILILSKGYKQRVGIAQALLGSPQIIILDEPTVGLDPAQVIEIRKLIQELGRAHTVILSSHILSEIQTVCQQILILSKGHLVASGTLEELTVGGRSLEEVFLECTGSDSEKEGEADKE